MGWVFVGMVLLAILAFSTLSIARTMKRWAYVIEEQGRHLEALNRVDNIHHQHLTTIAREVYKDGE